MPEYARFKDRFTSGKQLRSGVLFVCDDCEQSWILTAPDPVRSDMFMRRVADGRLGLILAWNDGSLEVSGKLRALLAKIGRTPPDIYGNGAGTLQFPSRVLLRDGMIIDPAIVHLSNDPPWDSYPKRIRLLSEIETVTESEFALPKHVRFATTRAEETRMGYAPVAVRAFDGTPFILNWTTNVFMHGKYRGCQIDLDLHPDRTTHAAPVVQSDANQATYFWGDCPLDESDLVIRQGSLD